MSWGFLFLFVLVGGSLIYFQWKTGVPPFPAFSKEKKAVLQLLQQAELPNRPIIYELGCGWGGLLKDIARTFPEARVIGIELSWVPYLISRWRTRKLENVLVKRGDFMKDCLVDADALTAYLMMEPMGPLAKKLDEELEKGTPVIALSFLMRHRTPSVVSWGRGLFHADAALYHWPASTE